MIVIFVLYVLLENLVFNKYVWEDSFWKGNINWRGWNVVDGKWYDCSVYGG